VASSLALISKVRSLQKLQAQMAADRAPRPEAVPELATQPKALPQFTESILDFQTRISPNLRRPVHFRLYAERLESGVGGEHRLVFAAPPQHGKTQITLHGLVWLILRYPARCHAYITYGQTRARSVARVVRRILADAGVVVAGTLDSMILPGGGRCHFTSIDKGIMGEPVTGVAIIDDPYKNRREADSPARRTLIEEVYRDAIETRVHPGGSIFLLATRWHPVDLSGLLIGEGWENINLPAIAEEGDPNGRAIGEALFPEMWSEKDLAAKRQKVLEFTWAALYQGRPRPKGGKVFHEPTYYAKLPQTYRGGFGVDLAYTAKTNADHSICLELWREERPKQDPLFYVKWVDRAQVEPPEFALTLKARHVQRSSWKMLWRASGTEKGSASFLQRQNLPLLVKHPPGDKLVSATDVAAAWNEGRILVPDPEAFPGCEDWLYPFLDIIQNFTGTGKEHDDDVDALGNAFELLRSGDSGGASVAKSKNR
jgi:phage terminase large subunit-like protein